MGCKTWILPIILVFEVTSAYGDNPRIERTGSTGPHFKIATILDPPYTMIKKGQANEFEGFIPDLIDALASSMRFSYEFSLVKDGRYGMCRVENNETTCNGLIGEVVRKEVDIAAAPLTVTKLREHHVDFVRAFQNLGITAVVKKPKRTSPAEPPLQFDVFRPLKIEVYVVVFASGLVVGLVLWLMNRFNPYEWGCQRHLSDGEAGSRFNLLASFWFVFASLQWQGFDRAPRSMASRVLTIFWFMFVTVTLVTYTGSALNHLFWASNVQEATDSSLPRSIQEMVASKEYDYGVVEGGSTNRMLKLGTGEMYGTINSYWESARGKNAFVRSMQEGIDRVLQSKRKYAFFMESATAKYMANRNCELSIINDIIHPRSFALAVSTGFQHLDSLHISMMELLESGVVTRLENKWWNSGGKCSAKEEASKKTVVSLRTPRPVDLGSFWGALVLLAVGLVLSLLTAAAEMLFFRLRGQISKSSDGAQQLTAPFDDQQT